MSRLKRANQYKMLKILNQNQVNQINEKIKKKMDFIINEYKTNPETFDNYKTIEEWLTNEKYYGEVSYEWGLEIMKEMGLSEDMEEQVMRFVNKYMEKIYQQYNV